MSRAANVLFLSALGIWVGGMITLGVVVAPVVFRSLPSRLQAGTVFGNVLQVFGWFEIAWGAVCVICLLLMRLSGGLGSRALLVRLGAIVIMLALVGVSQFHLAPELVRERERLVGFDAIPSGTPEKARFDRLHRLSVRLAGATLVIGCGVLALSLASAKPADGR